MRVQPPLKFTTGIVGEVLSIIFINYIEYFKEKKNISFKLNAKCLTCFDFLTVNCIPNPNKYQRPPPI